MNWLKNRLRKWLGIEMTAHICAAQVLETYVKEQFSPALDETRQRIQDLEDAYPGYKQAKEDADKTPEPLIAGFMPFSQRKKQFERSRRKPEKK